MVVEVVEPLKAGLVDLFGEGRSHTCVLHLCFKKVECGQCKGSGEHQKDRSRPRQSLPRHFLHHEIEGEVHTKVGEKDEEENWQELCFKDEQEKRAEESVDEHEDDQEAKPGKSE